MTAGKRVMVVGGTNFDVIVQAARLPDEHEKLRGGVCAAVSGGSAANTALGLVRQDCEVRLVSAVGDDPLGRVCLDDLRAGGVDTTLVRVDPSNRTSMALVFSSGDSKRMMTFAGADRELAIAAVREADVRDVDHVHIVGEPTPLLARIVELTHAAGQSLSIEWNGRDMSRLARGPSLNLMNADEAARIAEASSDDPTLTSRRLAERISADVVLTLGSRGALWVTPDGTLFHEPTVPVEPVDRTGGGDAFNAGVISGWLNGEAPVACMRRGLDAASHVISKMGAHP